MLKAENALKLPKKQISLQFQTRGWSRRFDDTRLPEKSVAEPPPKFKENVEVRLSFKLYVS